MIKLYALAVLAFFGLVGTIPSYSEESLRIHPKMKISLKSDWKATQLPLTTPTGPRPTEAQQTVVGYHHGGKTSHEFQVVGLYEPISRALWIGRKLPLYVFTGGAILGVGVNNGYLDVFVSALTGRAENQAELLSALQRFQTEVDGLKLTTADVRIDLRNILSTWFFNKEPKSMFPGQVKIKNSSLRNNALTLQLESPRGDYKATIAVNLSAMKLTEATQDGRRVYPQ